MPLTDDLQTLQAANNYQVVQDHSKTGGGQTFLHLGIVWGLRTLSPLWRDVWDTQSVSGEALPRTPCESGGTTLGCSALAKKANVIISDGENWFGRTPLGRSFGSYERGTPVAANPAFATSSCDGVVSSGRYPDSLLATAYRTAMSAETPAAFANGFDVDSDGTFSATGLAAVLDGFQAFHPTTSGLDPNVLADQLVINAYRARWENALDGMTPWQLFRGYDHRLTTQTDATDVLMTASNWFEVRRPSGQEQALLQASQAVQRIWPGGRTGPDRRRPSRGRCRAILVARRNGTEQPFEKLLSTQHWQPTRRLVSSGLQPRREARCTHPRDIYRHQYIWP